MRVARPWVRQAAKAGRLPVPNATAGNRHLKELLGEKGCELAILRGAVKIADRIPTAAASPRSPGSRESAV